MTYIKNDGKNTVIGNEYIERSFDSRSQRRLFREAEARNLR